jgi:hypothetical protein
MPYPIIHSSYLQVSDPKAYGPLVFKNYTVSKKKCPEDTLSTLTLAYGTLKN